MQIYVENKLVAIKKGSSFDYISENRLFSDSDGFSLEITFPLKDCHQNIAVFGNIDRVDVLLNKVVFDCEIRDRSFIKVGSLTVTEVSENEVKCQFLEGRSEQNFDATFDKIYINELELGEGPASSRSGISPEDAWNPDFTNRKCVALPWINNSSDSGLAHNFANAVYKPNSIDDIDHWTWDSEDSDDITWQPYLLYILKTIVEHEKIGYRLALNDLESGNVLKNLIICNCLPAAWDLPDFSNVLPHWTIEEFLHNLELFLGGEFDIDHRNKVISFHFISDIAKLDTEFITNVVDDHTVEEDIEADECQYLESKNLGYKQDDADIWKYLSCRWYLKKKSGSVVEYDTLKELIDANKDFRTVSKRSDVSFSTRNNNLSKLLYARDIDTYFIIRVAQRTPASIVGGNTFYNYIMFLQPVNIYGPRIVNENNEDSVEEMDILPAPVDFIPQFDNKVYYDRWKCIYLNVGSFSDSDVPEEGFRSGYDVTGMQNDLLNGNAGGKAQYFDKLYIAYWDGRIPENRFMPFPAVEDVKVNYDWSGYESYDFNFRLEGKRSFHNVIHKINPKTKYNFKFLADRIPDVRAVFNIRGKRYVCEKITATFTEYGMSQLLKGVFYPIVD